MALELRASKKNQYQKMFWGSKGRRALKADSLIAISEPII
jgi:hypothetical protein